MQKIAKGFIGIALLFMQGNLLAQQQFNIQAAAKSTVILNVQIIDGTGALPMQGAVRFKGDKIMEVGNLKPVKGESIVDGKGLTLAPGFIDAHSHHLGDLQRNPRHHHGGDWPGWRRVSNGLFGKRHARKTYCCKCCQLYRTFKFERRSDG